jgi:ABC-type glycerol-3-phosphate transport system permease component
LKSPLQFNKSTIGLPPGNIAEWSWDNYLNAFKEISTDYPGVPGAKVYLPEMLFNSVLYALGCAFFASFIPCITAYGCAKFPYLSSKVIYTIVIVVMGLPIVGSLPSEIMMAKNLGLYDHIWGVWLMKANFLGMYFIVFHATFSSLPKDFAEAAKIDGASNARILFQISMPMVRNTFFVIMLLKFIDFWNDYQTVLIYLQHYPTAAIGIYSFSFSYGTESSWEPMKITGGMLLLVPVLIAFLCFHSKIIGNVSMGGVKE